MTTITDLVHDVINYLVTACNASTSLGAATPSVLVIDGPTPAGEELVPQQRVWIGYDALTGASEAGQALQAFQYVGNSAGRRREDGQITCTAEAYSGDTTMANARATCKALVGAVEVLLRGYPGQLGPGDASMGGLVQWAEVAGPYVWTQSQDENGCSAMCVFRITYRAYLNP
jgi:hypothetical protein